MTNAKRILMLMATSCLIVLLATSFALAEEPELPSDEAIIATLSKLYSSGVDAKCKVEDKFKHPDGFYRIFLLNKKDRSITDVFYLLPLTSGKWKVGYYMTTTKGAPGNSSISKQQFIGKTIE
ncbi:hypothetical protein ACFLZI_01805 [Nitrospirota bacterium]